MCPWHRKIQLIISAQEETPKPEEKKKKERVQSRIVKRKTVNKNPNWNHNSNSIFYNNSFSNIRYDDKKEEEVKDQSDLLWINGAQYNEKDEIKSLKDLIMRLFHDPYFGEKRETAKRKSK